MGTMKQSVLRAAVAALLGTAAGFVWVPGASAQQALLGSDIPAGITIFPKVRGDSSLGIDTVIQLGNTSDESTTVYCYFVNAEGVCSVQGTPCLSDFDCPRGEDCESTVVDQPLCQPVNFTIRLTPQMNIGWNLTSGLPVLPCDEGALVNPCPENPPGTPQTAAGNIPDRDPFFGELKCFQIDPDSQLPVDRNDLIGKATIVNGDPLDSYTYNAIGIQSADTNNGDRVLCLGENADPPCDNRDYASCPATILVNHFFEGAIVEGRIVSNELTMAPCSQFPEPRVGGTVDLVDETVQILVFNEFEQRLSSSVSFECFDNRLLADVDTRRNYTPDNPTSVFAVGVQGTLAGQTRLRGTVSPDATEGHGILAVLTETLTVPNGGALIGSAARNVHFVGVRSQADVIQIPLLTAP